MLESERGGGEGVETEKGWRQKGVETKRGGVGKGVETEKVWRQKVVEREKGETKKEDGTEKGKRKMWGIRMRCSRRG